MVTAGCKRQSDYMHVCKWGRICMLHVMEYKTNTPIGVQSVLCPVSSRLLLSLHYQNPPWHIWWHLFRGIWVCLPISFHNPSRGFMANRRPLTAASQKLLNLLHICIPRACCFIGCEHHLVLTYCRMSYMQKFKSVSNLFRTLWAMVMMLDLQTQLTSTDDLEKEKKRHICTARLFLLSFTI